ncbi:hypothetical protein [Maribacter flavus]|uniref:Uncharacterized protein n=1 Tax=Maribacter flavus TaxID=1658664 RepID=A0A5B2TWP6_9FLAO|nr:hypothetical protein [Maribacter flavus]KAA2218543.1 hypothetical protein F0361_02665 [Maribacter flavus]
MDTSTRRAMELEFLMLTKNLTNKFSVGMFNSEFGSNEGYFPDAETERKFALFIDPIKKEGERNIYNVDEVMEVEKNYDLVSFLIHVQFQDFSEPIK